MQFTSPFSVSNRKIDPMRRPVSQRTLLPDGTPNDNDRVEIGPTDLAFREWAARGLTPPDMPGLRNYRLGRLLQALAQRGYSGLLLFDPLNIRYAPTPRICRSGPCITPRGRALSGRMVMWCCGIFTAAITFRRICH